MNNNNSVYIIGSMLHPFFKNMKIEATRKYICFDKYDGVLEIWSINKKDLPAVQEAINDDNMRKKYCASKYSWLYYCDNMSDIPVPNETYKINGIDILAWDGKEREQYYINSCENECSDMMVGYCRGTDKDIEDCLRPRRYDDLMYYFNFELKMYELKEDCDMCKYIFALAKYNNMSILDLFKKLHVNLY